MVEKAAIPAKLYRIGEIMAHTGLSRQTLHNYTVRGLITEVARTSGNHRMYDESVFLRLQKIKALRAKHTLSEMRMLFEQENHASLGIVPEARLGASD